ncbi:MAG: hypothetical protein ACM3H7_06095, partial [Acidobacteriaceae bacterium]
MSDDFRHLQVLECPSCGASLALPDAETFNCDYCGKLIMVPAELRRAESIGRPTQNEDRPAPIQPSWQQSGLPGAEETIARQRRAKLVLISALTVFLMLAGLGAFLLAMIPTEQSTSVYEPAEVTLPVSPLPTLVQFARLDM